MESHDNPFIGIADVGQAEHIINKFRMEHPDETDTLLTMLADMLTALLESGERLCGDADDFHNFAVTISQVSNDNRNAYAIVKEGLKIHGHNTDLLADAIMYGNNSGEKDECQHWYEILTGIDKSRWTWRSFSFTINYLLNLYASKSGDVFSSDDIIKLANEYQKYLPEREDAWISLYRIYNEINQQEDGVKILEEAIAKFKFCPKCWLRYADIMVDRGEFDKAEPIIRKMLRNPKTSEFVNSSYVHYLDGQCKMAKLLDSDGFEDGTVDEKLVVSIYRAFRLARKTQGLKENTNQRIDEYIERLEMETGINYD